MRLLLLNLVLIVFSANSLALEPCPAEIESNALVVPVAPAHWPRRLESAWVIVSFKISRDGSVSDVEAIRYSNKLFRRSAVKAAEKLKYKPREKNCKNEVEYVFVRD